MGKHLARNFAKGLSFLVIGVLIFMGLQRIFIPKHLPYDKTYDIGKLGYFSGEEKDSIDVLICGTSHASRGIMPMEMYESYGIRSYNLAVSRQPLPASYYTLREALDSQNPKVIVWDVSNLYMDGSDPACWKLAMDEMAPGGNRRQFVEDYLEKFEGGGESFAELFFPLLGYHTRWKELTEEDFCAGSREHYFAKGGQIFSSVAGGISDDEMNAITDELLRNTVKEVYEYDGTEASEWQEENILYSSNVVESNIEWVLKMKEMCEENQISLLAVKVPDVYAPQTYHSAWTGEKYDRTRAFCEEYGIPYYDLLYDTDIGLRYEKDSNDGGMHLNLYGAQKVSLNLGQYLKEQYDLPDGHCEQWDRDLLSYQKVRKTAFLEMEQDFPAYIRMLANEYKEDTVFIAASDDMSQGLNEADINALRELGLQADYSRGGQHAYLAVIEEGEIKYEAMSNRPLNYSGVCGKSEKGYELYSSGWWTDPWASIRLDGQEYAVNVRGLNIVVYDDERGLVLDSVCFDTCAEYHTPVRNNGMINGLEEQFEKYMMEQEGR